LARSQLPLEIGQFYKSLGSDPLLLEKFKDFWELTNIDPRKTITFKGMSEGSLTMAEVARSVDSMLAH
jgi:hypothetical protein